MISPASLPKNADTGRAALIKRVASAAVMMPFAVAAIYFGSIWFVILVAAAAALMVWEWLALVGGDGTVNNISSNKGGGAGSLREPVLVSAATALAVLLSGISPGSGAILGMLIPSSLVLLKHRKEAGRATGWQLAGLWWIILPSIGLVWLRGRLPLGGPTTFWLVCLVWAVDIAAYAAGRRFGGPKLAPRISPKKTWSGLCGGVAAATLIGVVTALLTPSGHWWQIAWLSAGLGFVEQLGDMAESYAKRRFGVKDSGNLIPGHGGLLDRLDGMLAVSAAVSLLTLIGGDVLV